MCIPSTGAEMSIYAADVVAQLMTQVEQAQNQKKLTNVDVANISGVHRATVARAKNDHGLRLENFVAIAGAVGLSLAFKGKEEQVETAPEHIIHRGLSHFRTKGDQKYTDVRLERALAETWERKNADRPGSGPQLRELVPGFNQDHATAAATVVQWLGSQEGFAFLSEALKEAGFAITRA